MSGKSGVDTIGARFGIVEADFFATRSGVIELVGGFHGAVVECAKASALFFVFGVVRESTFVDIGGLLDGVLMFEIA